MTQDNHRIPVTVLTGFLGSGKTTLLNRILTAQHGKRVAVIENEYGELGIDHELVVNADEEIFEMNNGCICCTVRGDLIRILGSLIKRKNRFDYVLIETTGLADPAPVAQTFFVDDEMKESFALDAIVTLIDAKHVWQHIETSSECQEQIAFADVLLLNKIDLVTPEQLVRLEQKIRAMNRTCQIYRTLNAETDLANILDVRGFDLDAKLEMKANFLQEEEPFEWGGVYELAAGEYELRFESGPDPSMKIVFAPLAGRDEHVYETAKTEAKRLFAQRGPTLNSGARIRPAAELITLAFDDDGGFYTLRVDEPGCFAFFTQHMPAEFKMTFTHAGVGIEPIATHEYAASHTHDASVTSVGIEDARPLDIGKFDAWMGTILRTKGVDIFRMKGILNFAGKTNRFVFQGVHMLFDGKPDRAWKADETRASQLIFIGRNLDRAELESGFRGCLV